MQKVSKKRFFCKSWVKTCFFLSWVKTWFGASSVRWAPKTAAAVSGHNWKLPKKLWKWKDLQQLSASLASSRSSRGRSKRCATSILFVIWLCSAPYWSAFLKFVDTTDGICVKFSVRCTDVSTDAQMWAQMHSCVHRCTDVCTDAQICAQMHRCVQAGWKKLGEGETLLKRF